MKLRRYRVGEEVAIWEAFFQATHVSNARDYHPELIDRWAPQDKDMKEWAERLVEKNPFVAIIGEQIVGMAEIEPTGYIDYFYVHPEFQGQGVGTALMATIETEATGAGANRLFADVSVTAKPFFESRGFFVTEARSKTINDHPAPNFVMEKTLTIERDSPASA